jgi:zinc transport system ATP-binding protein
MVMEQGHTAQTGTGAAARSGVIEVRGVSFAYSGGPPVLDALDLTVTDGEFVGLIGPNGGGKTTLLKLILGMLRPQRGAVTVLGRPAASLGRDRRLLGYVPQDTLVSEQFPATVMDVVLMGTYASLGLFRHPGSKERDAARLAIREVGLEGLEEWRAGNLSGGQQQRLAIARAMVAQPRLLLLDEPTSGLDTGGQAQLFGLLDRLRRQYSLTVIMVSHDVTALAYYASELACLNRTLHWHDRSELISEAVLSKVYACELDAFLIRHRQHLADFHGKDSPAGHAHGPHCESGQRPAVADKPGESANAEAR